MTRSVRIGTLTFRVYNESRDKQHVNIEVTADGNDSAGNIDCTLREWHALQNASISATSHAAQLAEINRVQVQRDQAIAERDTLKRLLGEAVTLARHYVEHTLPMSRREADERIAAIAKEAGL